MARQSSSKCKRWRRNKESRKGGSRERINIGMCREIAREGGRREEKRRVLLFMSYSLP